MNTEDKAKAAEDFLNMIKEFWTWKKLSDEERTMFAERFERDTDLITGTYQQRYNAYLAMYNMFLNGLGYFKHPW